jgi:alpha-L-fucosidase
MYTSNADWHAAHYGTPDKFGYKEFIPLFTVPRYAPEAWADLFSRAGARYVIPIAEHHDFAYPAPGVPNDQLDPRYAGFYGPPIPGGMNEGNASKEFQRDWLARVQEQVDKCQPQMIYFDSGINPREHDEVELFAAAYYYLDYA